MNTNPFTLLILLAAIIAGAAILLIAIGWTLTFIVTYASEIAGLIILSVALCWGLKRFRKDK